MKRSIQPLIHLLSGRLAVRAIVVATATVACAPAAIAPPPTTVVAPAGRFESEIRSFEDSDRVRMPAPGGIVFVGSSSIRMWPDLRADFPGLNVIQRGFGGSRLDEVLQYAPRIVLPYRPTLVILYAGDNDVAENRTPQQILSDYKSFVKLMRDTLPNARIAYVSIKPSPSRWELADKMRAANALIQQYTATQPGLTYVDVFSPMIGANDRPRPELFLSDSLHMTRQGYDIWRGLLMPIVSSAGAR